MSDIFPHPAGRSNIATSPYFAQQYDRLKDPQLFRVVLAYRFGKMDLNLFKRKDMNSQGTAFTGATSSQKKNLPPGGFFYAVHRVVKTPFFT